MTTLDKYLAEVKARAAAVRKCFVAHETGILKRKPSQLVLTEDCDRLVAMVEAIKKVSLYAYGECICDSRDYDGAGLLTCIACRISEKIDAELGRIAGEGDEK